MNNYSILIADDDTSLLHAMTCRLESEGYTVHSTQDGYQALAIARREEPDLLILDINMPAGSGFSVFERVQAIDEIADVPVIFVTGLDIDSLPIAKTQMGRVQIVQKPFDTSTLLMTIKEALQIDTYLAQ